MIHLDLFSGIGGFAYAADQVWDSVQHIFCDNEPFAQEVLKKHWPESEIFDDIKEINSDSFNQRLERQLKEKGTGQSGQPDRAGQDQSPRPFILTGGFPCQPFSAAGLRRGTSDDRYLWPEMLRVIRLTEPEWVIAENVRGLATWDGGLVLETVCADLEAAGYEVQPFIIPAVAVNAPHRRDRIWFVAHTSIRSNRRHNRKSQEGQESKSGKSFGRRATANPRRKRRQQESRSSSGNEGSNEGWTAQNDYVPSSEDQINTNATNAGSQHGESRGVKELEADQTVRPEGIKEAQRFDVSDWGNDWLEIAARFCSVDDGLPVALDGLKLSKAQSRKEQLKAYGNAIVPEVAIEIMKAIEVSR